ncbi:hypothetical protein A3K63_02920 [Candidatus Micrarchaeota archaeon RBG_16_49_10]|nr:MAG: hypothetical protein A3K63_02920 [Candidatus Micrarchaeota archaeon RBG_16_49_10]
MKPKIEFSKKAKVLIITSLIAFAFLVVGIMTGDGGIIGNMLILSVFVVSIPFMIITYMDYRRFKEMELRFPDFLRDLVESTKSGIPLHKAIINANQTNYGPLSDEINKMANQLSWNVSLIKVLEQFNKRMTPSPVLRKLIRVIIETYKSGGLIYRTLDSLSVTLNTIQDTEK